MATYSTNIPVSFVQEWLRPFNPDNVFDITTSGTSITSMSFFTPEGFSRIEGSFSDPDRDGIADGPLTAIRSFDSFGNITRQMTEISMNLSEFDALTATGNAVLVNSQLLRGDDNIAGSTGSDILLGFDGNDFIQGASALSNSDGDDIILGNAGADTIFGFEGNDSIVGGSDLLDRNDGADNLSGGAGNDHIYGAAGDDIIQGDSGNDLLVGVYGNDTLTGGEGNDIFVMLNDGGYDHITDFSNGDIITIERNDTIQSYVDVMQNITTDGTHSFLQLEANGGVLLTFVNANELDSGDFFFYG